MNWIRGAIIIFGLLCLVFVIQGCAIHYENNKTFSGLADNIKTPYGNISGVKVKFKSTFEAWFPWKFKEVGNEDQ